MKRGVVVLALLLLIPSAYSISIKELISRYSFSASSPELDVTGFTDSMIDKDNNGINDTLVFELTASNGNGNYIFVINLFDSGGVITSEANKTLNSGTNKINITFDSIFLTQAQFNYSIKIYSSTYSLKYRKDNIQTQIYRNYEGRFKILGVKDFKEGKTLKINLTLNSSVNLTSESALFLAYNGSVIFSKQNISIADSVQDLEFDFDSEAIKDTHYTGSFNITSFRLNKKIFKINSATAFYDFRDFASGSYISGFADTGIDTDNDGKYDLLQINADAQIMDDGDYDFLIALYDLFDNLVETRNVSQSLSAGERTIKFNINGSKIYDKKLNGPFIVKYAEVHHNGALEDKINDAYATSYYNFNDFDSPSLPDLKTEIIVSDGYHYGINNVAVTFNFKNIGLKRAFNVFTESFDNITFFKSSVFNILNAGSESSYQVNFTGISDFEISAIADLDDVVEESDESNNAEKIVIRLNNKPVLEPVSNITANEKDKIILVLSASDPNGDALSFAINSTKFYSGDNVFQWNTSSTDSGDYTFMATVSDGFLSDSAIFNVVVNDITENDMDNDGIDDSIDMLIGNKSSVNTATLNLSILVNGSSDLFQKFNKSSNVAFLDGNYKIMEFMFDFSAYRLNLTKITADKQLPSQKGSMLVRGLDMPNGSKKIMYVDKSLKFLKQLCIKDTKVASISNISKKCSRKDEVKITCNGKFTKSYRCTYNLTSKKYRVEGLKNTGIVQI
ncbi:hypothetical protein HYW20_02065 [Candidatus Woesearchaeota archaeon]|nr:hypothetical protein [Candidatus Woesearchaeota archaeon]